MEEQKIGLKFILNEPSFIPEWTSEIKEDAILHLGPDVQIKLKPAVLAQTLNVKSTTKDHFEQTFKAGANLEVHQELSELGEFKKDLELLLAGNSLEVSVQRLEMILEFRDAFKLNPFEYVFQGDYAKSGAEEFKNGRKKNLKKDDEFVIQYKDAKFTLDKNMIGSEDSLSLHKGTDGVLDLTDRVDLASTATFSEMMKIPFCQKANIRESEIFDFFQVLKAVIAKTDYTEGLFRACDIILKKRAPGTVGESWSMLRYDVRQEAVPTTILVPALKDYKNLIDLLQQNAKDSTTVFQWVTRGPVHICVPEEKVQDFVDQLTSFMRARKAPNNEKDLPCSRKEATSKLIAMGAVQPCQESESANLAPAILRLKNPDEAYTFKCFMGPVIFVSAFRSLTSMWNLVEKHHLESTSVLYYDDEAEISLDEVEEHSKIREIYQNQLRRLITPQCSREDIYSIIRGQENANSGLKDSVETFLHAAWENGVEGSFDGDGKIFEFPLYRLETMLAQINNIYSGVLDNAKKGRVIEVLEKMISEYCKRNEISQKKELLRKYVPETDEHLWNDSRNGDLTVLYRRILHVQRKAVYVTAARVDDAKNQLEVKLEKHAKRYY